MQIYEFLKQELYNTTMNLTEFAGRIGERVDVTSKMLRGKHSISRETLNKMCDELSLDADDVYEQYKDYFLNAINRGRKKMIKPDAEAEEQEEPVKKNPAPVPVHVKKVKKMEPVQKEKAIPFGLTEAEANDPAELFINMMHMFIAELNDNGKRATMAAMKILREQEAFKR